MWEEMFVGCAATREMVRDALAAALGLREDDIDIIAGHADVLRPAPPTAHLVVDWITYEGGDYPLALSSTWRRDPVEADSLTVTRQVAARLGCPCLIDEGKGHATEWVRVWPDGRAERVWIDPDAEERNEYRVSKVVERLVSAVS